MGYPSSVEFQSQMRCQAPGDQAILVNSRFIVRVSISDEMPGPWRLDCHIVRQCGVCLFQSQMRCQAPGDVPVLVTSTATGVVSISDEMPGPWRP